MMFLSCELLNIHIVKRKSDLGTDTLPSESRSRSHSLERALSTAFKSVSSKISHLGASDIESEEGQGQSQSQSSSDKTNEVADVRTPTTS